MEFTERHFAEINTERFFLMPERGFTAYRDSRKTSNRRLADLENWINTGKDRAGSAIGFMAEIHTRDVLREMFKESDVEVLSAPLRFDNPKSGKGVDVLLCVKTQDSRREYFRPFLGIDVTIAKQAEYGLNKKPGLSQTTETPAIILPLRDVSFRLQYREIIYGDYLRNVLRPAILREMYNPLLGIGTTEGARILNLYKKLICEGIEAFESQVSPLTDTSERKLEYVKKLFGC